jgi:sulfoxide reductase heme-binding subunit YedZ
MAATRRRRPLPWLEPAVLLGALAPVGSIAWRARSGELGANPIAEALNELGLLALVFLIASLACTPLGTLFGWTWPIRIRRMLGLVAFSYASLHFSVYVVLDQGLDVRAVLVDIAKRKFILVGFTALVLLIPLALTSTAASVRRLGYVRWRRLHSLVYPAAVLAVIHFAWRVKKDLSVPMVYAAILAVLLLVRVVTRLRRGASSPSRAAVSPVPDGAPR